MDPKHLENEFSLHIEVDDGHPKLNELIVTTHDEQDGDLRSSYTRYSRPSRQETSIYGSSITCLQCQCNPESGVDSENLNLLRSRDFKSRPPYHEKIKASADNKSFQFCQQEVNNQYKNTAQINALQATPNKPSSRSTPSFANGLVPNSKENFMKEMVLQKESMLEELKQQPPEIILPATTRKSVAVQTDCVKISTRNIGSQINSKSEFYQQDNSVCVNNGSEDKNHSKSSTFHGHKYEEAQNKNKFQDKDVKCTVKNFMNKSDAIFDHEDIHLKTGYIVMFVVTLKLFVIWLVAQIFVLGPYITVGDSFNDNGSYYLYSIFSKIIYFLTSETVIW